MTSITLEEKQTQNMHEEKGIQDTEGSHLEAKERGLGKQTGHMTLDFQFQKQVK